MVFDDTVSTMEHMRKITVPENWRILIDEHSEIATQENFTIAKECHLNKYSNMPLPSEIWQEDSIEPGPQDLHLGSDPHNAPNGMTEEPVSVQVIKAISNTPIPSTGEVSHHLRRIHQVSHYNSSQNPTEINLDVETLASPSVEEHEFPSQSSCIIP